MHKAVKTTVGAIITRQEDGVEKLLLTRRMVPPFQNLFCLPGGHIERFETAREAIIREVKEETGLDFAPCFFNYCDEIIPAQDWHAVVLVFTGTATGELQPDPAEVAEARWLSVTESRSYPLAFRHNDIIAAYADRHSAP
jgi:8-oxo-dGTP diphosphatase